MSTPETDRRGESYEQDLCIDEIHTLQGKLDVANKLLAQARTLALRFVNKCDCGLAKSKETYADCKHFLRDLDREAENV